jgi:HK97 family phage major capsid protein
MSTVTELKNQRDLAIAKADGIVSVAERGKRQLTPHESNTFDAHMREVAAIDTQLAKQQPSTADQMETIRKMRAQFPAVSGTNHTNNRSTHRAMPTRLSTDYAHAFHSGYLCGGPLSAALEEGTSPAGGYAVPVVVDSQIVPLAPSDLAVRRLATVVPTTSDVYVPLTTTLATATPKAEGASFGISSPSLNQVLLSAFPVGFEVQASFEIAQDVRLFMSFVGNDAALAVQELEEQFFVTGTGSGQAQGLIGNVGAGVTEEPDGLGNVVSIAGTYDVLGTLKDTYHAGASWLMQRATSIILRKAQVQSGLFEHVFTRENGQDHLHGYPVAYSASMPSAARGNAPILFGDFARGYVIGDRGGSTILANVLDQAYAAQGLIGVLFFRRTDGRVRRSEAIQQYNVAAS